MWENKSDVGTDPHPFGTWWFSIYRLLSATLPLTVRIILLDTFSDGSSFFVACVYSHCRQTNQNRSTTSLTSPVSCFFEKNLIAFLINRFTVIAILWQIIFVWWWVWRWWVWIWFPWYVLFSILLWQFCWLCQWRKLWQFCSSWNWINRWRCSVSHIRTKSRRVQRWLTHRNILAPKISIFPPSFKTSFSIIVLLLPSPAHSICCNFTNMMAMRYPVGSIRQNYDSGSAGWRRTRVHLCVDRREPQIHKVWTFGEDRVSREVHPTSRADIGAEFVVEFATN